MEMVAMLTERERQGRMMKPRDEDGGDDMLR